MDLEGFEWRKSSYSAPNGGECVEVGAVPASAWRKASRSDEIGDNCVEVADAVGGAALRDSKDPDGGVLALSRDGFEAVLEAVRAR
ncbi:DUF397 domain-containing protein [Actinomadura rupiterrae]|uniref:DUF397 domain-containing protein n=1 Tax=Actinomadura rupiterrae TaxID=559627 RepID=UPI0020A333AA|nr:DUF397 domain-containing protein [Actinomadura rupiterrae]MCP2339771.1 hypothetical protein [Actinomadura rupiterrae]